jgi:hypothetical protein
MKVLLLYYFINTYFCHNATKIVTVSLIFNYDTFWPYATIIRCYAKLFTALLVSILKLKLKLELKFKLKYVTLLNLKETVSIFLLDH